MEKKIVRSETMQARMPALEESLIRNTLSRVNGSVTRAAKQMGMSYQGLAYIIQCRHPELLKERSPVRHRSRKRDKESQRVSQD